MNAPERNRPGAGVRPVLCFLCLWLWAPVADAQSSDHEAAAGRDFAAELLQDDDGRPIDQSVAMLRHSFRFEKDSGIGQLARAVNAGDSHAAQRVLVDESLSPEVRRLVPGAPQSSAYSA